MRATTWRVAIIFSPRPASRRRLTEGISREGPYRLDGNTADRSQMRTIRRIPVDPHYLDRKIRMYERISSSVFVG